MRPDGTGQPVAGQAKALDQAREEWRKAARAADADALYSHYDRGSALLEGRAAVTARKALGLATTPPAREADGGGGFSAGRAATSRCDGGYNGEKVPA